MKMSRKFKFSSKQTRSELEFSSRRTRSQQHRFSTAPFSAGGKERRDAATAEDLPDAVRFLFENFKSIYLEDFRGDQLGGRTGSEAGQSLADPPARSGEDDPKKATEDDCIAILTYAPSPFREFRRSMSEMVEARLRSGDELGWDFLEELLFRYLNLNKEKSHRDIVLAFVDLAVVLHENEWRFL